MEGKEVAKKSVASLIITLLIAYFFTGLLRTITLKNNISENMKDPLGNIDFIVNGNIQIQVFVPLLTVVLFGVVFSKLGGRKGYQDASDHGVHGTSRWARIEELIKGRAVSSKNKYSERNPIKSTKVENGLVLAKTPKKQELLIIPRSTTIDNRNVLIIGSSGSGKGQSFVFPNLINNREETMIVTDPKGELYHATSQLKKDQGYEVFQIDFINFAMNSYNPLDYVKDDQDAIQVAKTISKNSKNDDKEDFFFNTAKDLLAGLIIYCKSVNPKASIPVDVKREFYKLSDNENYLTELCETIGENHPAYKLLKDASIAEGKTRTSILSSFAQQTAIFSLDKIAKMTTKSDFNFREFQKKKSILYIKIRMDENPFTPLTATFFDQIISVFYDIADENHSSLPIPSIFLLDEFANIGKIEKYGRVLATCRGLGMSMNTVIQDIAQLEGVYSKELARSILNNHDTVLYLRTKDVETAKYFSSLAGDTTVRMTTSSSSQSGGIFTNNSSASKSRQEQYVKRPLVTEGELMNIHPNTCYVFVSGYFPLKMEKSFQYKIYGEFLFDKDRKPNYANNRETYLKSLGAVLDTGKEEVANKTSNTYSDGGMEIQEEVAVTQEVEELHHEVEEKNEGIETSEQELMENMAQQYVNGEFNLIEERLLNETITQPEKDEEIAEQFKELSDIVDLVKIDKQNFIEAEKSFQKTQESEELLNNIDELDDILGSYFEQPDKLSDELDEDFSLVE